MPECARRAGKPAPPHSADKSAQSKAGASFLRAAILWLAWAILLSARAWGTVGESAVFTFDTRDFDGLSGGRVSGGTPPFTFRWDIDGDGIFGDRTGPSVSFPKTSTGETLPLRLEVTDATLAKAYARGKVTLQKAAVPK